jgi:hypothetical protein
MKVTWTDSSGSVITLSGGAGAGHAVSAIAGRVVRAADVTTSANGQVRVYPGGGQTVTLSFNVTGDGLARPDVGALGTLKLEAPDGAWALFTSARITSAQDYVAAAAVAGVSYSIISTTVPVSGGGSVGLILTDGLGRILTNGRGYILFSPSII